VKRASQKDHISKMETSTASRDLMQLCFETTNDWSIEDSGSKRWRRAEIKLQLIVDAWHWQ